MPSLELPLPLDDQSLDELELLLLDQSLDDELLRLLQEPEELLRELELLEEDEPL